MCYTCRYAKLSHVKIAFRQPAGVLGRQNNIAALMTHVDFPLMKVRVRTSEELTAEGNVEHHGESDGNAPKTRQPLDREEDGTPEVQ